MSARLVLGPGRQTSRHRLVVGAALALATGILLLTNLAPIGQFVRLLDPIAYVGGLSDHRRGLRFAAWVPTMHAAATSTR